ncbi:MAG: hypothetical protein QOD80_190 [Verrucomicrobiota bacterium]|jgi:hypothetical protein
MTFKSLRTELSPSGGFKLAALLSLWLLALPLSTCLAERSEEKVSNRELRKSHLIVLAYQEAVRTMAQDCAEAGPDRGGFREEDIVSFRADVSYGDMRTDGSEVAAVEVHYHLGEAGTANFSGVFLYGLQGGGARLLDRVKGGDRAHGGIKSAFISFDDGRLIIERYRPSKADCNSCYGFVETTQYELRGTKLVTKNVKMDPMPEKNK